jgi:hypothetical protein
MVGQHRADQTQAGTIWQGHHQRRSRNHLLRRRRRGDWAGLEILSVGSMGQYGNFTQGGTGDLLSVVEGSVGTLLVRGDLVGATIGARNFSDTSDGKFTKS